MDWKVEKKEISESVWHFAYFDSDSNNSLAYRQVVQWWANETDETAKLFQAFHNEVFAEIPFKVFRWETPVVDIDRFDRGFEFVVLDSPSLDRLENPAPFRKPLDSASEDASAIQFENIGRNAMLVVPTPAGSNVNHCHLGAYLRSCNEAQKTALWCNTGQAMLERVSDKPVWLSTAGGGVAWLHIRLDDRPKYYGYKPYREA